ncbi:Nucleotide-binding universal stress protein, UspA family [Erythrobacter litoralis]|uniref:UspA domain-containing protein n=1 Tax=Erythrobacter litoralis TaxID=39960 RepID=A0A074N683_9SPHN|nr:universal stress protein [Erythrobacter litoralis]AOL24310.1 Nucleotide-binding universal stress protein, UspA family [Erythrobacter litoralis]KEO93447.1 hypothetical protein EH32_12085 [Erythrobacter litoralis]
MPTLSLFPSLRSELDPSRPDAAAIIACLDLSPHSQRVARLAAFLARETDRPLILFHAVSDEQPAGGLPDPLEWHLRRSRARRFLEEMAASIENFPGEIGIGIKEGQWQAGLAELCAMSGPATAVIGKSSVGDHVHLSASLLESGAGSLLVVPASARAERPARLRIMVPLDGSRFADAALARARAIAAATSAELLLAHVIPAAGIEEFGPPALGDLELQRRVDRRNERAACEFLEDALHRLEAEGIAARSRCLKGDPRAGLDRLMAEEQPGLVILSARGHGVKTCENMALGSTAAYLLDHASVPIMVVPIMMVPGRTATSPGPARQAGRAHGTVSGRGPLNRRPAAA